MFTVIIACSASIVDVFASFSGPPHNRHRRRDVEFGLSDKVSDHEFLMRKFCLLIANLRCRIEAAADLRLLMMCSAVFCAHESPGRTYR